MFLFKTAHTHTYIFLFQYFQHVLLFENARQTLIFPFCFDFFFCVKIFQTQMKKINKKIHYIKKKAKKKGHANQPKQNPTPAVPTTKQNKIKKNQNKNNNNNSSTKQQTIKQNAIKFSEK